VVLHLLGFGRRLAILSIELTARPGVLLAAALLILLRRLIHRIQDAEVVLGVLEIAFRHHAIAAAGRITSELQVFFE
jgi:hypothetical protein